MLRRFLCSCSSISSSSPLDASFRKKKNLVFLGSPQVAASVLDKLFTASKSPDSIFEVAAIVTQPASVSGRGKKLLPSPVAQLALDNDFSEELIFTPRRASEANFLSDLKELSPDLCVTAAYGNILPQKFLDIPPCGTVNIHPSLLPLYRGAAPVQRALQDGVKETGVSLAYTIRALDAGPIIAAEKFEVDDCIKAPELLSILFGLGSDILLRELPFILDGSAKDTAQNQDDSKATLAPKLTNEDSWLSFDEDAIVLHNKVRAFAGWPGTRARFRIAKFESDGFDDQEIKVISTRVSENYNKAKAEAEDENEILFSRDALQIPCAGGSWLEVLELQLPGKKAMRARDFWNGLRGVKVEKLLRSHAILA